MDSLKAINSYPVGGDYPESVITSRYDGFTSQLCRMVHLYAIVPLFRLRPFFPNVSLGIWYHIPDSVPGGAHIYARGAAYEQWSRDVSNRDLNDLSITSDPSPPEPLTAGV